MSLLDSAFAAGLHLEVVGEDLEVTGPDLIVNAWVGRLRAGKTEILDLLRNSALAERRRSWRAVLADCSLIALSPSPVTANEMLSVVRHQFGADRVARVEPI
ncbi:MAG: hypothetical protein AB7E72_13415 [Lysobacterales bacterium]